jgi:HD-like signal output (HDOD) protein
MASLQERYGNQKMLGKLIELFSKGGDTDVPVQLAHCDIIIDTDDHVSCNDSWTKIDQAFTGMMLGVNSLVDSPMSKVQKVSLDSIYDQYLKNAMPEYLVPRLPAVIPKIMMALRDKDMDVSSLAKVLSGDMALVGEVIRLANSAYYSRSRVYESLEQAICNIGFNGIRQLILSASLKPILSSETGHFTRISSRYLWDKSMYAGLLSDRVAKALGEDRFQAYLAGLTVQSGMTVLAKELDKNFCIMGAPHNRPYIDNLNRYVYEVSVRISKQWQFPEEVTHAISEQVTCKNPMTMSNLGQITYLSDKLAKLRLLVSNGHIEPFAGDVSKLIKGDMHDVYALCQKQLNVDD